MPKIGPSKNGVQVSDTPASRHSSPMRIAATYEYVLAKSNQNSRDRSRRRSLMRRLKPSRAMEHRLGTDDGKVPKACHEHGSAPSLREVGEGYDPGVKQHRETLSDGGYEER